MSSFMSYFGGRRDPKQSARDAIVTLREQLHMIEKKEDYLQRKIDEELKRAKANATTNKSGTPPVLSIATRPLPLSMSSKCSNLLDSIDSLTMSLIPPRGIHTDCACLYQRQRLPYDERRCTRPSWISFPEHGYNSRHRLTPLNQRTSTWRQCRR